MAAQPQPNSQSQSQPKPKAKPIPDGYQTATPYLVLDGAAKAIEFYRKAFDAKEILRMGGPGEKIGHAEIQIGNSRIMLADEFPSMGALGPKTLGGSPTSILLYVEDVDGRFARAIAAGAKSVRPVKDQFYGDRSGTLEDPFGHVWTIATHTEDVPLDEIQRRCEQVMKTSCAGG